MNGIRYLLDTNFILDILKSNPIHDNTAQKNGTETGKITMISVKAHYNQGRIVFLEPIPADIVTAELNIVIIPSEKKPAEIFSQKHDCSSRRSGEEEF